MRTIVVHRSKYGHTRSYAEWLAESLGADAAEVGETPSLTDYDVAVLLAPIYMGKMPGVAPFFERAASSPATVLLGATVGGSDPATDEGRASIEAAIDRAVPDELKPRIEWFHLRGGLDYPRMSFVDRILMRYPLSQMRKQQRERGETPTPIRETMKSVVDFRERAALDPIIERIRALDDREAADGE